MSGGSTGNLADCLPNGEVTLGELKTHLPTAIERLRKAGCAVEAAILEESVRRVRALHQELSTFERVLRAVENVESGDWTDGAIVDAAKDRRDEMGY